MVALARPLGFRPRAAWIGREERNLLDWTPAAAALHGREGPNKAEGGGGGEEEGKAVAAVMGIRRRLLPWRRRRNGDLRVNIEKSVF